MKHVDDKPGNWIPESNHEPQWLQVAFKPHIKGDYERAMAELVKILAPIMCDDRNALQYVIVPTRAFDPFNRMYVYRIDAIHIKSFLRNPSEWEWR